MIRAECGEGLVVYTLEDVISETELRFSMTTADGFAMAASSVTYTEKEPGFVDLTYILSSHLPVTGSLR